MKRLIIIISLLVVTGLTAPAWGQTKKCERLGPKERFACALEVISWVEVSLEGSA